MEIAEDIDRDLVTRIIDSTILDQSWKEVERLYGRKAAAKLKELLPADPDFLYDMAVFSYKTDGKTEKEIKKILDEYSHDDWNYDMEHFAKTVKKVKKLALTEVIKTN